MTRQYFGTDGIRGTVGQRPITPDFILHLAHAVGRVLKSQEAHPVVLIGKDTRISGYMLESALESGFNSAGVDVVLLGPVPTPAVAYLTRAQRASLGVVISASHNPFADNGIKFFSAQGKKLPDEWEKKVEATLLEEPVWVDSAALGKTRRLNDAAGRYIEFCKSTFSNDLTLKGLKIVVDAAHGAAYQIAPKVFHELGAEVVAMGCSPDGLNINKGVGATHPEALVQMVKDHGADYGIALDGDADRLQFVDASGRLFNGDELLYLMVADRLARDEAVPGAVGTTGHAHTACCPYKNCSTIRLTHRQMPSLGPLMIGRMNSPVNFSSQEAKKKGTTGMTNHSSVCHDPGWGTPTIKAMLAQFTRPALMASRPFELKGGWKGWKKSKEGNEENWSKKMNYGSLNFSRWLITLF
jgi:phosphomannomutase